MPIKSCSLSHTKLTEWSLKLRKLFKRFFSKCWKTWILTFLELMYTFSETLVALMLNNIRDSDWCRCLVQSAMRPRRQMPVLFPWVQTVHCASSSLSRLCLQTETPNNLSNAETLQETSVSQWNYCYCWHCTTTVSQPLYRTTCVTGRHS